MFQWKIEWNLFFGVCIYMRLFLCTLVCVTVLIFEIVKYVMCI